MSETSPLVSIEVNIQGTEGPIITNGLSVFMTSFFVVGDIAGSGVLALPHALSQTGWTGAALVVVFVLLSVYTGSKLGESWSIVRERFPEYRGHIRHPYVVMGQVCYGKCGSFAVTFCLLFTLTGAAVVYLVLATQNIHDIIKSHWHEFPLSFCELLPVVGLVLGFPLMLGSPKDMWQIAAGATGATTLAIIFLMIQMLDDKQTHPNPVYASPDFTSVFAALGIMVFSTSGHPSFPTFQMDMKKQEKFGQAVFIGYTVIMIMYLPVAITGYVVYGVDTNANILRTVTQGTWQVTASQALITLHVLLAFILVFNPVCQFCEEVTKVPRKFTWKRFLARSALQAVVICIALTVPRFGGILSLVGGSAVTLLSFVFPSLFYLKLRSISSQETKNHVPLHTRVLNWEIILIGCAAGASATYSAVFSLAAPGSFTKPCWANFTSVTGN